MDKIKGLVWGSALADALGEFYEGNACINGEYKVLPHEVDFKNERNDWTDDTDQLSILLDNLSNNNMKIQIFELADQFKYWHTTNFKTEFNFERKRHIGMYTNFILSQRAYLQDPINSCRRSFELMGGNNAANGAIMRNSICGITTNWIYNSIQHCIATHPDSRCVASCLLQSYIINCFFNETNIRWQYIYNLCSKYILNNAHTKRNISEFNKFFKIGMDFKEQMDSTKFIEYIKKLDIGNYETNDGQCYTLLCMSLCIIISVDIIHNEHNIDIDIDYFTTRISEIISLGGDADTNACVVGSIIGVIIGYENLPNKWYLKIANKEFLDTKLDKFIEIFNSM
jgi:ADP-ribosylglycohydrolase